VTPGSKGPHPGILYVHWFDGEPNSKSNKDEFLDEAIKLAEQGAVSLLVDDVFANALSLGRSSDADDDSRLVVQQVIELRRAIDVLASLPEVDSKRLAFVGHDFGGMFGAVLAGVDKRIKTYVLLALVGDFGDWFLYNRPKPAAYRNTMRTVAPLEYVKQAAPASILFQFATSDKYVSSSASGDLFDAASEPKRVAKYPSNHALHKNQEAARDRLEWLQKELGLSASK
jgi:cephalosporin-C deacetylase-like acetyl esterase